MGQLYRLYRQSVPTRDIPGHGHILMSHSAMPFATFMGISSETTLIGATECRGRGDCCCSALASLLLPASKREWGCPRQPWAAPDGQGLPQMAMGCPRWVESLRGSHGAESSRCSAGQTSDTSEQEVGAARLDCDTGLGAQRDSNAGPAASLPTLSTVCPMFPKQRGSTTDSTSSAA